MRAPRHRASLSRWRRGAPLRRDTSRVPALGRSAGSSDHPRGECLPIGVDASKAPSLCT